MCSNRSPDAQPGILSLKRLQFLQSLVPILWLDVQPISQCIKTGILPPAASWQRRCTLLLFLASNDIHFILTRPILCLLDSCWYLGHAIGQPMPGLGSPGLCHRCLFLEQRSVVLFLMSHCSMRENLDSLLGLVFDDAPLTFDASSIES